MKICSDLYMSVYVHGSAAAETGEKRLGVGDMEKYVAVY